MRASVAAEPRLTTSSAGSPVDKPKNEKAEKFTFKSVRYGSEGRQRVVKGVYSSSDDRVRLTYRCTEYMALSRWIQLVNPVA